MSNEKAKVIEQALTVGEAVNELVSRFIHGGPVTRGRIVVTLAEHAKMAAAWEQRMQEYEARKLDDDAMAAKINEFVVMSREEVAELRLMRAAYEAEHKKRAGFVNGVLDAISHGWGVTKAEIKKLE